MPKDVSINYGKVLLIFSTGTSEYDDVFHEISNREYRHIVTGSNMGYNDNLVKEVKDKNIPAYMYNRENGTTDFTYYGPVDTFGDHEARKVPVGVSATGYEQMKQVMYTNTVPVVVTESLVPTTHMHFKEAGVNFLGTIDPVGPSLHCCFIVAELNDEHKHGHDSGYVTKFSSELDLLERIGFMKNIKVKEENDKEKEKAKLITPEQRILKERKKNELATKKKEERRVERVRRAAMSADEREREDEEKAIVKRDKLVLEFSKRSLKRKRNSK